MPRMSSFSNNTRKSPVDVLVLAAGLGTRMKSGIAKVLHQLDGRPLIAHVCRTAAKLGPRKIYVVVGHQAEQVRAAVADAHSTILVLAGDVPLVRAETLSNLLTIHDQDRAACTILTVRMENPVGYGRIVRDEGNAFHRIVEQKDANEDEQQIREVNSGIYGFDGAKLFRALEQVQPANRQGEYYLTDVPAILTNNHERVSLSQHLDVREVSGINTRAELAEFENLVRRRTIRRLMLDAGVTFIDPAHSYISSEARIGRDCVIHPDVHIEGPCVIGEACQIQHGARIVNSTLGNRVTIKDHSVIVTSTIEDDCSVGPFAHLRMAVHMRERAAMGNRSE